MVTSLLTEDMFNIALWVTMEDVMSLPAEKTTPTWANILH